MSTISDRIKWCKQLDVDAALAASPYHPPGGRKDNGQWADTREVVLAGLHKARSVQPDVFTSAEVLESIAWLNNNGWKVPKDKSAFSYAV